MIRRPVATLLPLLLLKRSGVELDRDAMLLAEAGEDGPLGDGAHSDLERILESELYRFTRVYFGIVQRLVTAQ